MSGLRRLAARLRPTSRRGAVALALAGAGLVVAAVIGIVFVLPWALTTYTLQPAESARSWAALTPQYADSALCQQCHLREYEPWQAAEHAVVSCESCHGPLAEHAATAPAEVPEGQASGVVVEAPQENLCVLCHEQSPGRPDGLAVVDLSRHFGGAPCLGCHEPHAVKALAPPFISHPVDRLPACVTCHVPDGLKPVPVGHEPAPDATCRTCHLLPAGSE